MHVQWGKDEWLNLHFGHLYSKLSFEGCLSFVICCDELYTQTDKTCTMRLSITAISVLYNAHTDVTDDK